MIWHLLLSALFPTLAVATCSGSEALQGAKGVDYRGCQDKTRSGRTCQKWTSQSPQSHTKAPENHPGKGLGDHNYCRNPDGELTIWCYTTGDKRWESCNPQDNSLVTECEYTQCEAGFTALNASGLRQSCYENADVVQWSSLATCCPGIKEAGMCALRNCTSERDTYSYDEDSKYQGNTPRSATLKVGGYDLGLGWHLVLSGLMCACRADCEEASKVIDEVLKGDALALIMEMNNQGENHRLMPAVCASTGWPCVSASANCKELMNLPALRLGKTAVDGVANTNCKDLPAAISNITNAPATQHGLRHSSARSHSALIGSAHSHFSMGGMLIAVTSAWLSHVGLRA